MRPPETDLPEMIRPSAPEMIRPFALENDAATIMLGRAKPVECYLRRNGFWAAALFRANRILGGRIIFGRRRPYHFEQIDFLATASFRARFSEKEREASIKHCLCRNARFYVKSWAFRPAVAF